MNKEKTLEPIVGDETAKGLLSKKEIEILSKAGIIPSGTPPEQVAVFAYVCREAGLSPFAKEIYLVKYNSRSGPIFASIVGIDGLRKKAARTGELGGIDAPLFDLQANGNYKTAYELKSAGKLPTSATVTVWRIVKGQRVPFTHTALFSEFYNGKKGPRGAGGNLKWDQMPFQMISNISEKFALKKAFSEQFPGLSIAEEEGAFVNVTANPANSITAISTLPERVEVDGLEFEEREEALELIRQGLEERTTELELNAYFRQNRDQWINDEEIVEMFKKRKLQIKTK